MRSQDWIIWGIAVALSLLLHGLLFVDTGSVSGNQEVAKPQRSVTRVSFRAATAPPTKAQPQPVVEPPAPAPQVKETKEPPPQPEKPKGTKRAKRTVEPAAKPVEEQKPAPEPIAAAATAVETEKVAEPAPAVTGTVADPALIEKARQAYLRRLMAHIEAHKEYPRAARRRRIEGDVKVTFTLQPGGVVGRLQAQGGHRLLSDAASQAVERALPMPPPPETLVLPWEVGFTMRFSLN
jgi:protein TonB